MSDVLRFSSYMDDNFSRNPLGRVEFRSDLDFLNEYLIKQALFGEQIILRVGMIAFHPPYRDALIDDEISPLRSFIRNGYVKLISSTGGINSTIRHRIQSGTRSAINAFGTEYSSTNKYFDPMLKFEHELNTRNILICQYSASIRQKFHLVSGIIKDPILHSGIFNSSDSDALQIVWERWWDAGQYESTTRNRVLDIVKGTLDLRDQESAYRNFMWICDLAHSFAQCAERAESMPDMLIEADTVAYSPVTSLFCEEVVRSPLSPSELTVRQRITRQWNQYLQIPVGLLQHSALWDRLALAISPDNQERTALDLRESKRYLMESIRHDLLFRKFDPKTALDIVKSFKSCLSAAIGANSFSGPSLNADFSLATQEIKNSYLPSKATDWLIEGVSAFGKTYFVKEFGFDFGWDYLAEPLKVGAKRVIQKGGEKLRNLVSSARLDGDSGDWFLDGIDSHPFGSVTSPHRLSRRKLIHHRLLAV